MIKKIAAIALAAAIMLSVCACSGDVKPETRTAFYFDTIVDIYLYGCKNSEEVFTHIFKLCAYYEKLFSAHDEESEISRLNSANGKPLELSDETVELIQLGIDYAQRSGGVFDITCGALTSLWDFTGEDAAPPRAEDIAAALGTIGYGNIEADGNFVSLKNGAKIDLGGIAKGYVADRLKEEMIALGVESAIINLGGNVLTVGDKFGAPFKVGVRSPFEPSADIVVAQVKDISVVTAGSYERSFEYGGETYHHILDLSSGMPARNGLVSVTVFSDSSLDGDAYATTCFLLGSQAGLELIESLDGIQALFITESGEMIRSSGCPC